MWCHSRAPTGTRRRISTDIDACTSSMLASNIGAPPTLSMPSRGWSARNHGRYRSKKTRTKFTRSMVRLYERLMRVVEMLHHFTTHEWDFQTKRMLEIWDMMSKEDQQVNSTWCSSVKASHYRFSTLTYDNSTGITTCTTTCSASSATFSRTT